jgi:hypothetical protein
LNQALTLKPNAGGAIKAKIREALQLLAKWSLIKSADSIKAADFYDFDASS